MNKFVYYLKYFSLFLIKLKLFFVIVIFLLIIMNYVNIYDSIFITSLAIMVIMQKIVRILM